MLAINAASAALDALGHPVRRPDRRRAHRVHAGRPLDPAPDLRGGRRVDLRARRRRPSGRRGDIAIMMVEAGGTEKASDVLRGRRAEGHRRGHRRRARGVQGRGSTSRSTCSASWSRRPASARRSQFDADARLHRRDLRAGRRRSAREPLAEASTIADKAERNAATDAATSVDHRRSSAAEARRSRAEQRDQGRRALAAEEGRPQAHRRGGHPHRRPRPDRPAPGLRRGRRAARRRTAPACSSGARRRCSTSSRSACRRWTSCSTPSRPRTKQALHAPLQHAAPRQRRDRPRRQPEASRDRPRPARRAGAAAGRAERGEFPYTLRLVSEVLASNGSTSMGSVCASSLSLMDAGVPIKAPVAGIAMGLVYDEGKYTTLTDILGAEDAFGDMDFKVAGTARVRHRAAARHQDRRPARPTCWRQALQQANEARLQILEVMNEGHRRAPRRGRRDRAEDRQLRDPDGQDRRGHRAQGQGHQRHPARDRRRHLRRRRRHGRHRHHRLGRRRSGRGGRAPDPADPQPADGRASARSTRAGS